MSTAHGSEVAVIHIAYAAPAPFGWTQAGLFLGATGAAAYIPWCSDAYRPDGSGRYGCAIDRADLASRVRRTLARLLPSPWPGETGDLPTSYYTPLTADDGHGRLVVLEQRPRPQGQSDYDYVLQVIDPQSGKVVQRRPLPRTPVTFASPPSPYAVYVGGTVFYFGTEAIPNDVTGPATTPVIVAVQE